MYFVSNDGNEAVQLTIIIDIIIIKVNDIQSIVTQPHQQNNSTMQAMKKQTLDDYQSTSDNLTRSLPLPNYISDDIPIRNINRNNIMVTMDSFFDKMHVRRGILLITVR